MNHSFRSSLTSISYSQKQNQNLITFLGVSGKNSEHFSFCFIGRQLQSRVNFPYDSIIKKIRHQSSKTKASRSSIIELRIKSSSLKLILRDLKSKSFPFKSQVQPKQEKFTFRPQQRSSIEHHSTRITTSPVQFPRNPSEKKIENLTTIESET